ncbi:MAG TPA: hypothetical protein VJO33_13420 [Gemmatimonadaceae bacterium]|nr:hypothetical protein [Gemmatimonadaceae bacterium]
MPFSTLSKRLHQILGGVAIVAMMSSVATAQTPVSSRMLEANDIQLAGAKADWVSVGILPNGYVRVHNASLRKLVAVAYGLPDSAVSGRRRCVAR